MGVSGGAVVVNAILNGGDPSLQQIVNAPDGVFVSQYHRQYKLDSTWEVPLFSSNEWSVLDWQNGSGGKANDGDNGTLLNTYDWSTNEWPVALPDGEKRSWVYTSQTTGYWETNQAGAPHLALEHCDIRWQGYQQAGTRTADTEMKLATGGPPGSQQMNLWCITASATAHTNVARINGIIVPPEQIQIGTLGNLDTNGELWVMLPDNDPPVVTPRVDGNDNYTFAVDAHEYRAEIKNNGTILDDTSVNITNCVGQRVNFALRWSPSSPPENVIDRIVAYWRLPGTFVNTNADPNCDLYYTKDGQQLINNVTKSSEVKTSCWFVNKQNTATASLNLNVWFTDGQSAKGQVTGKFKVFRPTTTFIPPISIDGAPTVMVTNGLLTLGNGRDRDMSFGHQINNDSQFSGQAGYVQLIEGEYTVSSTGLPLHVASNGGAGTPDIELDNVKFPRGTPPIPADTSRPVVFYDGPHVGLFQGNAKEDLEFETYLMFQPDGGIWVPLQLVKWELHDEAIGWTPQGRATKPSDDTTTDFPKWENIFSNLGF